MLPNQLIAQVKRHEGFSAVPYVCTAGVATIGYGTNLEVWPGHIPHTDLREQVEAGRLKGAALVAALLERGFVWIEERAETALLSELERCAARLERQCGAFERLCERGETVRAAVLVNMAFNLGVNGLLGFKNTLALIESGNYRQAAGAMLQSRWAEQVKGRAGELAAQMRSGAWQ